MEHSIAAILWEANNETAGVGIYSMVDGCPRNAIVQVEMTPTEMVDLAHDLLSTALRLQAGEAYTDTVFLPGELTPEDEAAFLDLLRQVDPKGDCDAD